MILRKYELGKKGYEFIQKELRKGSSFSEYVLQEVAPQVNNVVVYLPLDLQMLLDDFYRSILNSYSLIGGDVEKLHDELEMLKINLITQHLKEKRKNYALFELLGYPKAPVIQREELPCLFFEDEVYIFLSSDSVSIESIKKCFLKIRPYPLVIGLTSLPDQMDELQNRQSLDDATLRLLAKRSEYIIIGAYDAEGYLIWSHNI